VLQCVAGIAYALLPMYSTTPSFTHNHTNVFTRHIQTYYIYKHTHIHIHATQIHQFNIHTHHAPMLPQEHTTHSPSHSYRHMYSCNTYTRILYTHPSFPPLQQKHTTLSRTHTYLYSCNIDTPNQYSHPSCPDAATKTHYTLSHTLIHTHVFVQHIHTYSIHTPILLHCCNQNPLLFRAHTHIHSHATQTHQFNIYTHHAPLLPQKHTTHTLSHTYTHVFVQ